MPRPVRQLRSQHICVKLLKLLPAQARLLMQQS